MNAPLGQTGTETPLMRRAPSPLPMLPKMKFESRTVRSWSGFGYLTVICNGPRTAGTGGNLGFGAGMDAGMRGVGGTGVGSDRGIPGAQAAAVNVRHTAKSLTRGHFNLE